jgi:apolipoprotein N-acyltransferase
LRLSRSRLRHAAGAVASGVLLALARPPFDLGPLAFIALVPLFVAWRDSRPRGRAALAFIAGVVYHGILVSWTWYFGAVAIVPLVAALAGYWALVGASVGWFASRDMRAPWLTASLWVLADAMVARFPLQGFSWGEAAYALHDLPVARDVASVGGIALVTFAIVATNGLLADAVPHVRDLADWAPAARRRAQQALTRAGAGLCAIVLVTGVIVVGRPQPTPAGTLRVAVLQGNDKNRDLTQAEEDARYLPKSHFALAQGVEDPIDLIVFPESSMDEDPRTDSVLGVPLRRLAVKHHAWVLANAVADAPDGRALNLNVLYGPDGTVEGTYAKRHLVPYGERVPLRKFLESKIGALRRIPRDFAPGHKPGLFPIAGFDVATVICFESAFGYQIRPLVRDGAEVIIVSTNNRSYRRSANSAQHVAIGQMRAAETGRPVVQAAISGISAFIDASGRVHGRTRLFERTRLEQQVTAMRGTTLYVRFGEWVVWASGGVVLACIVADVVRRRRRSVDSSGRTEVVPALSATGDRT